MKRSVFLLFIAAIGVPAGDLTQTLTISREAIKFNAFADYTVVELKDGIKIPDPGKPSLPLITTTLVIPPGARVNTVAVRALVTEELPGTYKVFPAQPPVPISQKMPVPFYPPDPTIYSSERPFPTAPLVNYSTGNASGFKLLRIIACPFEYQPRSGKLRFHSRLEITVNYENTGFSAPAITTTQKKLALTSLKSLVANPEQLNTFSPPSKETDQPEIDYLIVTDAELAPHLLSYKEYRTTTGLRTEIRTTQWIDRNYPGRDLPEKIRNLVIDYYQNRGLCYLLLAGDNRQVPSRRIEVSVGNENGSIPTDLYYGDIDYSWDSNHNNRFGEMEDSVDLYADVVVGRASVDNPAQVQNFITKVQTFENNPVPAYIKRSLLPSGWLWRSLNYHGKIVNDSIAQLTPSDWTDRKMENPPSAQVVADSFDNGFLVFDPAGHGNESGVYDEDGTPIYTTGFAARQHNDRRFTVITSLACNPGNFEAEDCLAEVALNCTNGGAIGVIMNSRYGWGTPPEMGPSEKLCVRFYDFLFNYAESRLGTCHNRSRETYAGLASYSSLWRWCYTEFNLLGDPTVDIWTDTPQQLNISVPDTLFTGQQSITVQVNENNTPAPGVAVTAYKGEEVFGRGITSGTGQVELNIHPVTPGQLLITATRHNNLPATKSITIIQGDPEPLLTVQRYEIDDSGERNPNHILEPGETCRLKITLTNSGTASATNTTITLRSFNRYIITIDSIATAGTIAPQESVQIENLTITAPGTTPPGFSAEMLALLRSDQGEYQRHFSIELGYPGRTWANVDTGDCILTVTARGTVGYDPETGGGKGFCYPKSETSSLRIASFCIGNSEEYLVDRFYNQEQYGFDQDWQLQESLRVQLPIWNADQLIWGSFNDRNHPQTKGIIVEQRTLATTELNNCIFLVYDIWNTSPLPITSLYAGIIADFDVRITDRLHDIALTIQALNTALMRNVNLENRYLGIKLLNPANPAILTCIDHARYVYPESAMTEGMKFRTLTGNLGVSRADRPYNWSIGVATGPFELSANYGRQRLAFAFIAATDSTSYTVTCSASQSWFNNNVGINETTQSLPVKNHPRLAISPNPFTKQTNIHYHLPYAGRVSITVHDITGRKITTIIDQNQPAGNNKIIWKPRKLAQGLYFITLKTPFSLLTQRAVILR